jgi:hypothetical protein
MRAKTITITHPKPKAWQPLVALALAVWALVIPGAASAEPIDSGTYSSVNAITGGSGQSSQPSGGTDYASVNSVTGGSDESSQAVGSDLVDPGYSSRYSSLNAIAGPPASEPTLVSGSPTSTDDGFDALSAAIGAAAAMALASLAGAVFLTVRKRTAASPSLASMS